MPSVKEGDRKTMKIIEESGESSRGLWAISKLENKTPGIVAKVSISATRSFLRRRKAEVGNWDFSGKRGTNPFVQQVGK